MAEDVRKDQLRAQGVLDDYEGAMKGVTKDHGKLEFFKQKGGKIAEEVRSILDRKYGSLRDAFRSFDKDGSGEIDVKELEKGLAHLNISKKGEIEGLFAACDVDKDGQVNYEEFASVLKDFDGQNEDVVHGEYRGMDVDGMDAHNRGLAAMRLADERLSDQVHFRTSDAL